MTNDNPDESGRGDPDDPHAPLRDPNAHTLLENTYALVSAATLIAIGMVLMKGAGIVTAGVAGIALLVSYKVPLGVGLLFFVFNIPFFLLGLRVLGRGFVLRTVIACGLIFAMIAIAGASMDLRGVHPAFAAAAGGTCAGSGMLALLRHRTGVGGVNVIAVWLQQRRGWNVGRLHLVLDGTILLVAWATSLSLVQVGWSLLSVVAINMILVTWHKPGRYMGH